MKRLLLFFVIIAASVSSLWAQDVRFDVSAPRVVAAGTVFQYHFELNADPDRGSFVEPVAEGLTVVAGPAISSSSSKSVDFISGKSETHKIYGWSYNGYFEKEGEYVIGAASVKVDGKEYKSSPVTIRVIVEADNSNSNSGATVAPGNTAPNSNNSKQEAELRNDDILLVTSVDRSSVYVGQPVVVRYVLYSRVGYSAERRKMPSFASFWAQPLNSGHARNTREEYNGKIYDAKVVGEYLLFPQQAGQHSIETMELSVTAHIPISTGRRLSPLDEMFLGQATKQVHRIVRSNSPTITVKPLPADAPAGYSGAVGEFEMSVTPPADNIEANSALNYTVKISGSGNFSMIRTPELMLPGTFEQYTAKVSESINTTSRGVSGYRQFEYPIIARAEGDYVIPAMEFSYFSPKLSKYVTLTSQEYPVHVTPDSTAMASSTAGVIMGGSGREDLRILGQDIRFINLDKPNFKLQDRLFIFSGTYFAIVAIMFLLFAILCIWLSRYLKQMRNQAMLKGKRANKVALARFRMAESYMKQANTRGFYEEMLKGLWGYLSDKLNIPAADLTKENVRDRLAHKGVVADDIDRYISLITACEYAQYAPSASGSLEESYINGVAIISRLESVINK